MTEGFEFIEHTADYAMRVWAGDLRSLIEQGARGLIALVADVEGLEPMEWVGVRASGVEPEDVLVRSLRQVLILQDEGRLPVCAEVLDASETHAVLKIGTVPLESAADRVESHVKAVTYHDLHIRTSSQGLEVSIVFDT